MKEPIEHIERPYLPWRVKEESLTECGILAVKVRTLTRSDFHRRLKEWGERRTAITTCMTCTDAAKRWTDWQTDPRQAIEREILWEGIGSRWGNKDHGVRLRNELKAIEILIKKHLNEFTELRDSVAGTINLLAEKRKRKQE